MDLLSLQELKLMCQPETSQLQRSGFCGICLHKPSPVTVHLHHLLPVQKHL